MVIQVPCPSAILVTGGIAYGKATNEDKKSCCNRRRYILRKYIMNFSMIIEINKDTDIMQIKNIRCKTNNKASALPTGELSYERKPNKHLHQL